MNSELTELFCTITLVVSWLLGKISKRNPKISNYIIPIQNMLVGLIIAIIEWIITKDFKVAVAVSGIVAGGIYDILHNINILLKILINKDNDECNFDPTSDRKE